ncbi:hypothetical protein [Oceanithermus sp.]
MKKAAFLILLAVAALLAGCEIVLTAPGILPGTPVTVGSDEGATETVDPGAAGRFELVVGDKPVRIDVYQEDATPDGDLMIRVLDKDNQPYAHTNNRNYFMDTEVEITGAAAQGVVVNAPYSINLPANFGKAYVMVNNMSSAAQTVTVKAFERNVVEREGFEISNPSNGATSVGYGGAILFLQQRDTYVYNGADGYTLTFTVPGDDYLHLQLQIEGTNTLLTPGQQAQLLNGDRLTVSARDGAYAGFCASVDPGCSDGIDTGEYSLTISQ